MVLAIDHSKEIGTFWQLHFLWNLEHLKTRSNLYKSMIQAISSTWASLISWSKISFNGLHLISFCAFFGGWVTYLALWSWEPFSEITFKDTLENSVTEVFPGDEGLADDFGKGISCRDGPFDWALIISEEYLSYLFSFICSTTFFECSEFMVSVLLLMTLFFSWKLFTIMFTDRNINIERMITSFKNIFLSQI